MELFVEGAYTSLMCRLLFFKKIQEQNIWESLMNAHI